MNVTTLLSIHPLFLLPFPPQLSFLLSSSSSSSPLSSWLLPLSSVHTPYLFLSFLISAPDSLSPPSIPPYLWGPLPSVSSLHLITPPLPPPLPPSHSICNYSCSPHSLSPHPLTLPSWLHPLPSPCPPPLSDDSVQIGSVCVCVCVRSVAWHPWASCCSLPLSSTPSR